MGPPSPNLVTHSATNFDNAINDLEKALTTHNRVLPEVRNPAKNLITASKQYMESLQQEISNVKSQQSLNNNFSTYLEKIISVINSNNDEKNQTLANIAEMVTKMQSSLNNNATTPNLQRRSDQQQTRSTNYENYSSTFRKHSTKRHKKHYLPLHKPR